MFFAGTDIANSILFS